MAEEGKKDKKSKKKKKKLFKSRVLAKFTY